MKPSPFNSAVAWLLLVVLFLAITLCSLWCASYTLQSSGGLIDTLAPVVQVMSLLCVMVLVLAVSLIRFTILDRLALLRLHTIERLHRDRPEPLEGGDLISAIDQLSASVAGQRDEAILKEQAIADYASDVACSFNKELEFVVLGPTCFAVWGFISSDLAGRPFSDILPDQQLDISYENFENAYQSRKPVTFENQIVSASGELLDMSWSVEWSATDQLYFCAVQNITERKKVERMKEEFFAMISHDIKTPLSSLSIGLSVLANGQQGSLSERGAELLASAEKNAQRLVRLLEQLLEFEKMGATGFSIEPKEISLAHVLAESHRAVQSAVEAKQLIVTLPSDDLKVLADSDRLVQVLVNLLSNAINFSPENGALTVRASRVGGWVEVCVEDVGPGIPPNLCEYVFSPYKQIDESRDRRKGGSGLGLAICKRIIDAHGGSIGIRPASTRGTIVWFRLRGVGNK